MWYTGSSIAIVIYLIPKIIAINSQSAANMIATCSTGHKSLPLSAANVTHPDFSRINSIERILLTCLWCGDKPCALNAWSRLNDYGFFDSQAAIHGNGSNRGLNNDQAHAESFLAVYHRKVEQMTPKQALKDVTITVLGRSINSRLEFLNSLTLENYSMANAIILVLKEQFKVWDEEEEQILQNYQLALLLHKFPTSIYCPYSEQVLLSGQRSIDLKLLETVQEVNNRDYYDLKLAEMTVKNSTDATFLGHEMYIHWAANQPRIAAKYAKLILVLPLDIIIQNEVLWRDALSIRAAAFLCGETHDKGYEQFSPATLLLEEFTKRYGSRASYIKSMKDLADNRITWREAMNQVFIDRKKGHPVAPAIKNVPVLPS